MTEHTSSDNAEQSHRKNVSFLSFIFSIPKKEENCGIQTMKASALGFLSGCIAFGIHHVITIDQNPSEKPKFGSHGYIYKKELEQATKMYRNMGKNGLTWGIAVACFQLGDCISAKLRDKEDFWNSYLGAPMFGLALVLRGAPFSFGLGASASVMIGLTTFHYTKDYFVPIKQMEAEMEPEKKRYLKYRENEAEKRKQYILQMKQQQQQQQPSLQPQPPKEDTTLHS